MKLKIHKPWETRIIKRFLFLPLQLKNEKRWLEFVKIKQILVPWPNNNLVLQYFTLEEMDKNPRLYYLKWVDCRFME